MNSNVADVRSVEELIALIRRGTQPDYVFFWSHIPRSPDHVDQSCLSNWFPAPFRIDGIVYPTTEHHMMAEKARLFSDIDAQAQIMRSKEPRQAKALGRQVRGFDAEIWAANRFEIVVAGNYAKFHQNPELGQFLIQTGAKILVEASPYDRIWGIGLARGDHRAQDPSRWRGLNLLGFALMEVRERLTQPG